MNITKTSNILQTGSRSKSRRGRNPSIDLEKIENAVREIDTQGAWGRLRGEGGTAGGEGHERGGEHGAGGGPEDAGHGRPSGAVRPEIGHSAQNTIGPV